MLTCKLFVQPILVFQYFLPEFGPNQGVGRGGAGVGSSRSSTPGSSDHRAFVSSPTPGINISASAPPTQATSVVSKTKSSTVAHDDCRYFIMRCTNQKMVDISEAKGIWATSINNEAKLNRAFQVFIVNEV